MMEIKSLKIETFLLAVFIFIFAGNAYSAHKVCENVLRIPVDNRSISRMNGILDEDIRNKNLRAESLKRQLWAALREEALDESKITEIGRQLEDNGFIVSALDMPFYIEENREVQSKKRDYIYGDKAMLSLGLAEGEAKTNVYRYAEGGFSLTRKVLDPVGDRAGIEVAFISRTKKEEVFDGKGFYEHVALSRKDADALVITGRQVGIIAFRKFFRDVTIIDTEDSFDFSPHPGFFISGTFWLDDKDMDRDFSASDIRVLGDGQIWDLQDVVVAAENGNLSWEREYIKSIAAKDNIPIEDHVFEEWFSGKCLGDLAGYWDRGHPYKKVFENYLDDVGKINGLSVTKALNSGISEHVAASEEVIKTMADFAVRGILKLTSGTASRKREIAWSVEDWVNWGKVTDVVISAGVSEGQTGKILIDAIGKGLRDKGKSIRVHQGKWNGKSANILGSIANVLPVVLKKYKNIYKDRDIAIFGVDFGRTGCAVGCGAVHIRSGRLVGNNLSYISKVHKTPYFNDLSDEWRDIYEPGKAERYEQYVTSHKKEAIALRKKIITLMAEEIASGVREMENYGIEVSDSIGFAVPGKIEGRYITGGTDFLPLFQKKDRFCLAKELEDMIYKLTGVKYKIFLVNDGIAQGIGNVRFGMSFDDAQEELYIALMGPGTGLGGFLGKVIIKPQAISGVSANHSNAAALESSL